MMTGIAIPLLLLASEAATADFFYDSGRLSVYAPGDGFNAGRLACGNRVFTKTQIHIAYRRWWKVGCGRKVWVYTEDTARGVLASVQDAGPFGIYRGRLRNAVRDGRWKVWTKGKPPAGWRYRAVADLSWGLWEKLGRPRALSKVHLVFLPEKGLDTRSRIWHRIFRGGQLILSAIRALQKSRWWP